MHDKLQRLDCKVSIFIQIVSFGVGGEGISHEGQGAQSSHVQVVHDFGGWMVVTSLCRGGKGAASLSLCIFRGHHRS